MIPFFQNNPIPWSNMFPYPFCSFWNWIINDFSSISHYHDQMIVHQIYWMRIMIYFSFSTDSIIPWISSLNKCSLFVFAQFISHLQRKENSCYIMLNVVLTDMGWSMHKNRSWSNIVIFCKFFISRLSVYICIDFFVIIWDQCVGCFFILFFLYSFDQFLFY